MPKRLDYLVIGHATLDKAPGGGYVSGGTASYAARTALALGCSVGVITSAGTDLDLEALLPGAAVVRVPARATTTFENRYVRGGRVQFVHATAAPLTPSGVPPDWRDAAIVHIGPVAQECTPALVDLFPSSFLGLTPQGWMRCWDEQGLVRPARWEDADALLPRAGAVVLSEDDTGGDVESVTRWAARTHVVVVTRGAQGCTLYSGGQVEHLPGFPAVEVDPTGAGDVFAAVLFHQLQRGASPRAAAALANRLAAVSVTRPGLDGIPTTEEAARWLTSQSR